MYNPPICRFFQAGIRSGTQSTTVICAIFCSKVNLSRSTTPFSTRGLGWLGMNRPLACNRFNVPKIKTTASKMKKIPLDERIGDGLFFLLFIFFSLFSGLCSSFSDPKGQLFAFYFRFAVHPDIALSIVVIINPTQPFALLIQADRFLVDTLDGFPAAHL